jgi:MBG domain (YGX type)/Secretion system C-terminal sorting domain/Fibronectin type III domain
MKKFYSNFTTYFKRKVSLILILLIISFSLFSQSYSPIAVTGFNQDLVANGAATAALSTTTAFDDPSVNGNVFYVEDFKTGPYGLPASGIISSVSNTGIIYNLADYSSNNTLLLVGLNETKTLVLEEPGIYSSISVLAASAQGASIFSVTINYSDNTSEEVTSFNVPDWYYGANYAIQGVGRVSTFDEVFSGNTVDPRLYDNTLNVNSSKIITSLTFKKTSSGGRTGIFAICGITPAGVPIAATTNTATNITDASFTASWDAISGATNYRIDVATDNTFNTIVSAYNNLSVLGTSTVVSGLDSETTYYYRVRAENASGQSLSSNIIEVVTMVGPPGNALSFDGATENIVLTGLSSAITWSDDISWEAWFKSTGLPASGFSCIMGMEKTGVPRVRIYLTATTLVADYYNSSDPGFEVNYPHTSLHNDGQWHHIAYVIDATDPLTGNLKLFLDGVEVGSIAYSLASPVTVTSEEILIGETEYTANYSFMGKIDEIRIWQTALDITTIKSRMYSELAGNESNLVAYYNFNQTNGSSLTDNSTNSYDGTMVNMTDANWVESYALVYPISSDIITYDDVSFTFSWDAAETGTIEAYLIDVDDNSDFSSPLTSYNGFDSGTDTFELVTGLDPETTYYARVRGYKASVGEVGAWSDVKSVTTSKITTTVNGSLNADDKFKRPWLDSESTYEPVGNQHADDYVFTGDEVTKVTTGNTSYFTRTVVPSASGDNWTLEVTYSNIYDVVMYLYEGDFDPDSPLTNLYRAVDDGNNENDRWPLMDGTGLSSDGITLNSGQKYVLVIASFFSVDEGDFTVEIKGPGSALVHTLPAITSQTTTNIDLYTATGNANISYVGVPTATQHGVCWNTSGTPTITDNKTEEGPVSATGDYTSDITGLSINTTYYVRAYATNSAGTSYGSQVNFTTLKEDQTITFGSLSAKTYGDTDFDPGATASSGLTVAYSSSNTDIVTIVSGKIHIVGVGTCTIYANQAGNTSYNAASQGSQSLTINKATLTVTADDKSKTYGEANPTLSIAYTGFVNSDNEVDIDTEPTIETLADETSNVDTYDITLTGGTDDNYELDLGDGTLTVNKATLTVTAENKSKDQGEANPEFTFTYSGFVNSENESILDTEPTITSDADESSSSGTYDIVVSSGDDNNYSFNYIDGTLTINSTTGIVENYSSKFNLYPNPAVEILNVKSEGASIQTIEIIDLTGIVRISKTINNFETKISLNKLPKGVYLVQLKIENNTYTKRIIKN